MNNNLWNSVLTVACISLLSGCASMFQGSHQNLTIATINDKKPDNTRCEVTNEEGKWTTAPNAAVSIHRDGNNMSIECKNDFQSGATYVDPQFNGAYLGLDLLLDLCIISCIVDGVNNAFYEYPQFVTLPLKDK
ncbi:MAG: hypothetical protein HGB14_09870 [Anaerolineaceae bacterium]|nr:hypothetical protein [Anaerolineaceae bacterium]